MGLDQYLYVRKLAPIGSPLYDLIFSNLTPEQRLDLNKDHGFAYISGYSYGNTEPDELYVLLSKALKFTPHEGSPHFEINKTDDGYAIDGCLVYWRKVNAVHKWFVDNCQDGVDDCSDYTVHSEQLAELAGICRKVTENHELAAELLPTQAGFFFGHTDYDEYYFADIQLTYEDLEKQIRTIPVPCSFYYQSSW